MITASSGVTSEIIIAFVDSVSVTGQIDEEWARFITARREAELEQIIAEENLKPEETRAYVEMSFRDGGIATTGTAITKVLPPASRFTSDGGHAEKKQRVIEKLGAFFERFIGLGTGRLE